MMIFASLQYLVSTVYLFEEYKEGKWMRYDKIRNFEGFMWNFWKNFQINSVTSANYKDKMFSFNTSIFYHFREFYSIESFSSFVEENDCSFHFLEYFYELGSFFDFYVFWICVRDWFYSFQYGVLFDAFSVFCDGCAEMFETVSDGNYCDHEYQYMKK